MALDRSFGLHAICVRVGVGHKERGHKNGVYFRIHCLYPGGFLERGVIEDDSELRERELDPEEEMQNATGRCLR
jgi:hypothetical protein